jgi:hypothetical protein
MQEFTTILFDDCILGEGATKTNPVASFSAGPHVGEVWALFDPPHNYKAFVSGPPAVSKRHVP